MGKSIRITLSIALVCLVSSLIAFSDMPSASSPDTEADDIALLQFTSGGHVLGFGSSSVYMAGLDHAVRVEFYGGLPQQPVAEGAGEAQNGAVPLGRVTYRGAWENIDVIYSAVAGGIAESTYIVHPGGSPSDISLRYNTPVEIEQGGTLRLAFGNGYLSESAPVAWQEIDGRCSTVEVSFQRQGEKQVGFALSHYDSNHTLYIDPAYTWHTFYGSANIDEAYAIAVDSSNNICVAGISGGSWDGPAGQSPLHAYAGNYDITIIKLNSAGAYLWHTFYGSANDDKARAIAVDSASNICVAGYSGASWNGPAGQSPLHTHMGNSDITIVKLNSAGSYLWHTFYGSASIDLAFAMVVDSASNICVAGYSRASWDGPAGQSPLHAYTGDRDITIVKLNSAGAYLWHTFYGTNAFDEAYALALDSSDNICVGGYSNGSWYGPTGQSPLRAYTGGRDITIVKLNSAGAYLWHTFYGSNDNDDAYALALDSSDNICVGGYSYGSWYGPTGQSPLHAYTGNDDMTVIKVNDAPVPTITSFTPASGDTGTSVIISGTGFNCATAISFGGTPAAGFTVNSYSQLTAIVGTGSTGRISVTTPGGTANSAVDFTFDVPEQLIGTGTSGTSSHGAGAMATPVINQTPVSIPNIQVQSASLSASTASSGTPVTVTATVLNKGAADGATRVTLYVNGQEESSQGLSIPGNGSTQVSFPVSRSVPGTYTVYVGTASAGSFTVSDYDPNTVLYISGALILIALIGGLVIFTRRR